MGQMHVTQTLQSAILTHQLAHAYLFSGPRGVGKTTCARILAKAINCENLSEACEPCNQCESCVAFDQGGSMNIRELDAASNNSVDDIRRVIENVRYAPPRTSSGKEQRLVYIIDEVHMLSSSAFNAFLKTLEEPPAHVLFILATTEKHKILPTVLSRCQKFDFRRIKADDIAQHLDYITQAEKMEAEYSALQQIALKADGGLRDALSLYDQMMSYSGGKLTFALVLENLNILDYDYYFKAVDYIKENAHTELLLLLNQVIEKGFEAKGFLVGLLDHLRNLLMCLEPRTAELLEVSQNVKERYLIQCRALPPIVLLNAMNICSEADAQLRNVSYPRVWVELALYKLAHLEQAIRINVEGPTEANEKKK